jgi:hypothetical protein
MNIVLCSNTLLVIRIPAISFFKVDIDPDKRDSRMSVSYDEVFENQEKARILQWTSITIWYAL